MKNILFILLIISGSALAQHDGQLTRSNFYVGDCNVSSMTVNYTMDVFLGEPRVNGTFKWSNGYNTAVDCLPYSTVIWLEIQHVSGSKGFIKLDPVIPKAGSGYGYSVAGSPDWDELICGYKGKNKQGCVDEKSARIIFKEGRVTGFHVGF